MSQDNVIDIKSNQWCDLQYHIHSTMSLKSLNCHQCHSRPPMSLELQKTQLLISSPTRDVTCNIAFIQQWISHPTGSMRLTHCSQWCTPSHLQPLSYTVSSKLASETAASHSPWSTESDQRRRQRDRSAIRPQRFVPKDKIMGVVEIPRWKRDGQGSIDRDLDGKNPGRNKDHWRWDLRLPGTEWWQRG